MKIANISVTKEIIMKYFFHDEDWNRISTDINKFFKDYDWDKGLDSLVEELSSCYEKNKYRGIEYKMKISEDENDYIYDVVVPGLNKEDIIISYTKDSRGKNMLELEVKVDSPTIKKNTYRIYLEPDASDMVESTLKNGILHITVAIKETVKKTVEIKIE